MNMRKYLTGIDHEMITFLSRAPFSGTDGGMTGYAPVLWEGLAWMRRRRL
jgi:uncharacterized protein (TIGR03382 family)